MILRVATLLLLFAAPASADEPWVVFGSFRGGEFSGSIHAVRPDGSDERRLSIDPVGYPSSLDPWIIPEGDLVAFSRGDGRHRASVWLLDPVRPEEEQITGQVMTRSHNGRTWPSMRPGSGQLTYVRERSRERWIVLREWPGGEPVDLEQGEFPSWSSDGKRLAYVREEQGLAVVWVHDFDSGMRRRLPIDLHEARYPTWTPDGQRLLVVGRDRNAEDLYEVDLGGNIKRRLTETPAVTEVAPSWSPDGRYIAWAAPGSEAREGWEHSIYLLDLESGETREITSGEYHDARPTWARKLPDPDE